MASTETAICRDAAAALAASGLFAETHVGLDAASNAVPRASVAVEGREVFLSDDRPNGLWVRLRLRVFVRDRADNVGDGVARTADLCAAAGAALLADPKRGGLCRDLPVGRATELGATDKVTGVRRPAVEASLAVRCHYETEDAP